MKLPFGAQQFWSYVRQLAAGTGIGTQLANVGSLGTGRWIILALGGALLIVEHYVGDPSTGTTPPKASS